MSAAELALSASSRAQLLATPSLLNAPPFNASPALMEWAGVRAWRVELAAVGDTAMGPVAAPALCSLERFGAAGAIYYMIQPLAELYGDRMLVLKVS